ncbi:hypothetical protein [Vibrio diazotrophicus]|uniref:hypothetical protein n=1 Tax=Vibrio diazotrophicus TaxID=685 RepID=UPI000C9E9AC0|nr:hypothetical protein [Vibrio diazotrophicus]PNH87412.1 hypothetical protein C1M59_21470 [Vibrio diazotrophicus]
MMHTNKDERIKYVLQSVTHFLECSEEFNLVSLEMLGINLDIIKSLAEIFIELETAPYLNTTDFGSENSKQRKSIEIVGGINNIKNYLGVGNDLFSEMFSSKISTDISIPLYLYSSYGPEISDNQMRDQCTLDDKISVEIEGHHKINTVELADCTYVAIPKTLDDVLFIARYLLSHEYRFLNYDENESILTVEQLIDRKQIEIELRLLASHFKHTKITRGICIENDISFSRKEIINLSRLFGNINYK